VRRTRPFSVDPEAPDTADLVIMESTYGDRLHEPRDQRVRQLGDILTRALADNGKVFIPAFSLGRTQELIYEMDRIFSDPGYQEMFPDCRVNSARRYSSIRPWAWKSPGSMPACRILGQEARDAERARRSPHRLQGPLLRSRTTAIT
jgi:hypothetical protein